jgi:hypothetical protein
MHATGGRFRSLRPTALSQCAPATQDRPWPSDNKGEAARAVRGRASPRTNARIARGADQCGRDVTEGGRPARAQIDGLSGINPDDGSVNFVVATFVNSYVVVVVWILLQVSVAVLLVSYIIYLLCYTL